MTRSVLALCLLVSAWAGCRRRPAPSLSEVQMNDPAARRRILRGVYESKEAWRWTARVFAVSLDAPPPDQTLYVQLDFTLPVELMSQAGTATLLSSTGSVKSSCT